MDKEEIIKKAAEWLDANIADYATFDETDECDYWETKQKFLNDFREAMK